MPALRARKLFKNIFDPPAKVSRKWPKKTRFQKVQKKVQKVRFSTPSKSPNFAIFVRFAKNAAKRCIFFENRNFEKKFFGPRWGSTQKIFRPKKFFSTKNFFSTQKIFFDPKIFFRPPPTQKIFFGKKNFFRPPDPQGGQFRPQLWIFICPALGHP